MRRTKYERNDGAHEVKLSYPPPNRCEGCGKPAEPFASRTGWLCWACLPLPDKIDDLGRMVTEPILEGRAKADLILIRERLAVGAERCGTCRERRAAHELFREGERWVCADCRRLASPASVAMALENTACSRRSSEENAPGSTKWDGAPPEATPTINGPRNEHQAMRAV